MNNVAQFIQPGRQLSSWIAGFLELTEGIQSPSIFRRWAAITTIAGALERKVWLRSQHEDKFPNMFVFLVGPPGSGKTRALMACWRLWHCLTEHHIAEISLTKPAMIDTLADSKRVMHVSELEDFNSLLIASPELGALLPSYDAAFMNTLTHLYDGHLYSEKRRTAKTDFEPILRPNVNLIACTTPGFLMSSLPTSAWNEGFLSRVCIVYSGEITIKDFDLMDEKPSADPALEKALIHDLKKIGERVGRIVWTPAAAKLAEEYNRADFDLKDMLPKPSHPRLMHYNTRRPVHFLKLCMICAVDRGSINIDVPDVASAVDLMAELELNMGDIFSAMADGGDAQVMNDCHHWIMKESITKYAGNGVPALLVHEFLRTRAPATHIQRIFEVMTSSGMLIMHSVPGGYVVKARSKL